MSFKYSTGEEYYNRIYLIFNGLIALTLVPFVLLFLEIEKYGSDNPLVSGSLSYILIAIISATYIAIFYLGTSTYKKELTFISRDISLRQKLDAYYSVSLRKYIRLSGCCALTVIGLLLTKHFLFIIAYVFALGALSIGRPVLKNIINEIPLTKEQANILSDKKRID